MRAALLDLDGVFYVGDRAVPGGPETIAWLQRRGIPYLFLTNTTSRPREALVERLREIGITADRSQILTPPAAAVGWLQVHAPGPVALFVPEATVREFDELPQLAPELERGCASVVVGDLGERWDFPTLNRAFRLLMSEPKPQLVALGMTRYWRADDGLRLDVAPFVAALEHAAGVRAVVLGKPAAPFYEAALERLGAAASEVVMVGDDIVGDIAGAQQLGIRTVLVRTGKFQPSDLEGETAPDAVLDSIANLEAWWQAHQ